MSFPLNQLLKNNTADSFDPNDEQVKSFRTFIDNICLLTLLALPSRNLQYTLDTGTSAYGLGASLSQSYTNRQRKPIGFWPRSLNRAEQNYSATDHAHCAVVLALRTLRPYLLH